MYLTKTKLFILQHMFIHLYTVYEGFAFLSKEVQTSEDPQYQFLWRSAS